MTQFLSERCPNIGSLYSTCGEDHARIWIRTFGANLTKVHVESGHRMLDIPDFCPKLLDLSVTKANWDYVGDVTFWRNVGETVESVSTVFTSGNTLEIGLIARYCRKVKRLNFTIRNRGLNERISNCMASFGEQLEHVTSQFMSKANMDPVDVRYETGTNYDWRNCTKIEKVRFSGELSAADVRTFFRTPKILLKNIMFRTNPANEDFEEIISLIADGTGGLESVKMIDARPRDGVFNKLVTKNKKLSRVHFQSGVPLHIGDIVDILKSFLKSPSLARMEVFDGRLNIGTAAPKAVCYANRHRRVCISVACEPLLC